MKQHVTQYAGSLLSTFLALVIALTIQGNVFAATRQLLAHSLAEKCVFVVADGNYKCDTHNNVVVKISAKGSPQVVWWTDAYRSVFYDVPCHLTDQKDTTTNGRIYLAFCGGDFQSPPYDELGVASSIVVVCDDSGHVVAVFLGDTGHLTDVIISYKNVVLKYSFYGPYFQ